MVGALEPVLRAVFASVVSRRAVLLVRQIRAVAFAITFQLGLDAVAAVALEAVGRAVKVRTVLLVGAVATVVVVVAPPPLWYAFVVATPLIFI